MKMIVDKGFFIDARSSLAPGLKALQIKLEDEITKRLHSDHTCFILSQPHEITTIKVRRTFVQPAFYSQQESNESNISSLYRAFILHNLRTFSAETTSMASTDHCHCNRGRHRSLC
jgi:hypothetical protein